MKLNSSDCQRLNARRELKKQLAAEFANLSVEERAGYIPVNGDPSEFEIQSFIFENLKRMGIQVRGEVPSMCGTCVFDLVVYANNKPIRIIEVKKTTTGKGSKSMKKNEKKRRAAQVARYETFGVPVDLVSTMREAKEYIGKAQSQGVGLPPPTNQG